MPQNGADAGKLYLQLNDQFLHRLLLLPGTGICHIAVLIQSALIADSDGMCIPATGMGTHALQRTGGMYLAVTTDEKMVTDVTLVVHLHVVVVKLMHGVRVVAAGCAAVYHNHCNFSSHKLMFLMFQHCKDKTFS